jgi:anti-sigma regulatory factor (Ser/Thr protein kinase)
MNIRAVRDDLKDIGPAIAWAGAFIDQAGLSPKVRFAVDLSLEEALVNLIMHGRAGDGEKEIVVNVAADSAGATIIIQDRCEPFDLTLADAGANPDVLSVGGQGIRLLRAFTADMSYATAGRRNALTLRFARENAEAVPS